MIRESIVVLSFAAFVGVGCSQYAAQNTASTESSSAIAAANADPASQVEVASINTDDGALLYKQNCAVCHRETGVGGKIEIRGKRLNPANLTSGSYKRASDETLTNNILDGEPDDGMPAFRSKLSNEQVAAIVKYIRTDLQKK